jgi:hypothetical protein
MSHVFDKQTHRCKCGRWQAGFAPKKEEVRPRAECQICECVQALDGKGGLTNHGYRRPGWGFIVGSCYGCGHAPFPATGALEGYREALVRVIDNKRERLTALPTLQEIEYTYTFRVRSQKEKQKKTVTLRSGSKSSYNFEENVTVPAFADHIGHLIHEVTADINGATAELARVDARIAKGRQITADATK